MPPPQLRPTGWRCKPKGSEAFVSGLVEKYLSSAEYAKLAPRTKRRPLETP
jgi:hypothetical protein